MSSKNSHNNLWVLLLGILHPIGPGHKFRDINRISAKLLVTFIKETETSTLKYFCLCCTFGVKAKQKTSLILIADLNTTVKQAVLGIVYCFAYFYLTC